MDEKTKRIADDIEAGYDRMADKFSGTRKYFWRDLAWLENEIDENDRVLDFGCGNGRLLEILKNKKIDYRGVDVSEKLLAKAREKHPAFEEKFEKISAEERLPFPAGFFNKVFAIAVFHHFPPEMQVAKINELFTMLSVGGVLIATVWNLTDKYQPKEEVIIPFRDNLSQSFERYHYVFDEACLIALFSGVGFSSVKCYLENKRNWIVIAKK